MRASRTHMMRLYARTKNRKKGDRRQKTKANNVIFIYIYVCMYTHIRDLQIINQFFKSFTEITKV